MKPIAGFDQAVSALTRLPSASSYRKAAEMMRRSDDPAPALSIRVEIFAATFGSGVSARLWGKSSPILRAVPGNTRPAESAWWPTREAALAELPSLLCASVEVIERAAIRFVDFDKPEMVASIRRSERLTGDDMTTRITTPAEAKAVMAQALTEAGRCPQCAKPMDSEDGVCPCWKEGE